jgi:hypothetical protein
MKAMAVALANESRVSLNRAARHLVDANSLHHLQNRWSRSALSSGIIDRMRARISRFDWLRRTRAACWLVCCVILWNRQSGSAASMTPGDICSVFGVGFCFIFFIVF